MKTSDLFNFQFVDRSKEQKIINNFFQNITGKTLWIKGEMICTQNPGHIFMN